MSPVGLALWVALQLAPSTDAGDDARATAAQAEAAAFDALEEHRDCDAASAFMRAFSLVHDERILLNAGLAFERAGDSAAAHAAFAAIHDPSIAGKAATRMRAIESGPHDSRQCKRVTSTATIVPTSPSQPAPLTPAGPASTSTSTSPPSSGLPLLGAGITALACGALIGVGTIGGAAVQESVLYDPESGRGAKDAAIAASWALVATGSISGILIAGGSVLVPLSLMAAAPGDS